MKHTQDSNHNTVTGRRNFGNSAKITDAGLTLLPDEARRGQYVSCSIQVVHKSVVRWSVRKLVTLCVKHCYITETRIKDAASTRSRWQRFLGTASKRLYHFVRTHLLDLTVVLCTNREHHEALPARESPLPSNRAAYVIPPCSVMRLSRGNTARERRDLGSISLLSAVRKLRERRTKRSSLRVPFASNTCECCTGCCDRKSITFLSWEMGVPQKRRSGECRSWTTLQNIRKKP